MTDKENLALLDVKNDEANEITGSNDDGAITTSDVLDVANTTELIIKGDGDDTINLTGWTEVDDANGNGDYTLADGDTTYTLSIYGFADDNVTI